MRNVKMALLGLCLIGAGCDNHAPKDAVEVTHASVRLPVVPGRPGAAYFTITAGSQAATLEKVTSPRVERVELHESKTVGGVMQMKALSKVDIPAGGTTTFEPGGSHAMLFGIDSGLRPGQTMLLRFHFRQSPEVDVEAQVHSATDAGH